MKDETILCPVCKTECGLGATKCPFCGFTDQLGINRTWPIKEDLNYWLETTVIPYRQKWEAEKENYNPDFTILKPIDFLQNFLDNLVKFDENCKNIYAQAYQKEENQKIAYDKELLGVEQKHEHVNSAERKIKEAFNNYNQELKKLEKLEETNRNTIYTQITQARLSGGEPDAIKQLRLKLFVNKEQIQQKRDAILNNYLVECNNIGQERKSEQDRKNKEMLDTHISVAQKRKDFKVSSRRETERQIEDAEKTFNKSFGPRTVERKYAEIYADEPYAETYRCGTKIPENVCVAALSYDVSALIDSRTKKMLERYYPVLYNSDKLNLPFSLTFADGFNYLFEFNERNKEEGNKEILIDSVCSLAMRLFMMVPPGKINFTFIDPITSGDTFAIFNRLVDVNDHRTNIVINGQIWTSKTDIDDRLSELEKRIEYVIQRCLKKQYDNIQVYNKKAGQNAEPYKVLIIMDYPCNFNEESLSKLERIISKGPKCGIYTVILKSEEQVSKVDKKLVPLLNSIDTRIKNDGLRTVMKDGRIILSDNKFNGNDILLNMKLFSEKEQNTVIPVLKNGIKKADEIKIKFEESIGGEITEEKLLEEEHNGELIIPIGTYGAGEIQDLAFGKRFGCYHALIAGQTGSGKSSLLHTIIMSALKKYSAERLQIFLIDFKSGVEFKIFTEYKLDMIKAIAVESEREFGVSVLDELHKEMRNRAERFKRIGVDEIVDFRKKGNELNANSEDYIMPRILLIFDEFHVLFSKESDDLSRNAIKHLEEIAKQGRSFGVHLILSTQSLAGVGGISQDVWGQVGVRIAFKCPKEDAHLILREGNDAVDSLPQGSPGKAIYNSECGSAAKNTEFRVSYLEQETQKKLLNEISIRNSNKEHETRILLSNVEDSIYHPFQKFADGSKPDVFKENTILIGEPLQLFGKLQTSFKAKEKSNMLIIGNNLQKARAMFTFCSLSLALHTLAKNGYKKPQRLSIYILDYIPSEDNHDEDSLKILADLLPTYIKYVKSDDANNIKEVLEELHGDLPDGKSDDKASNDSKYLLLFGLQRARGLRQGGDQQQGRKHDIAGMDDESWLENESKQFISPYQIFLNILNHGPEKNLHTILWVDSFKTFQAHYQGWLDNFFDMRVGFTMPNEDSVLFMEEPYGSQISENNAVFSFNGNQKFRPYRVPDSGWLKRMCDCINSFQ